MHKTVGAQTQAHSYPTDGARGARRAGTRIGSIHHHPRARRARATRLCHMQRDRPTQRLPKYERRQPARGGGRAHARKVRPRVVHDAVKRVDQAHEPVGAPVRLVVKAVHLVAGGREARALTSS
jgi:hypothetical protein